MLGPEVIGENGRELTLLVIVQNTFHLKCMVRFMLWGHLERMSQVRGEGGSAQRGQSKATFIVKMTS